MPVKSQTLSPAWETSMGLAYVWLFNLLHFGAAWQANQWLAYHSGSDFLEFLLLSGALMGIFQLVYVLPLLFWARRRGSKPFANGIIIAASITLLLNAPICGWIVSK